MTAFGPGRCPSRTLPQPGGSSRPLAVYRERQQPGIQSLLCATHATPYVGDGLDRDGLCNKDRDSHSNEKDAAYDTRPAICFEHVCAYQAETTNHERNRTE